MQDTNNEVTALKAYGEQIGTEGLAPAGVKLYNAYTALTNALGFNSADYSS
jgi:hypothetical protein